MEFALPGLPYSRHSLEPFMSEETLDFHHGKHHAGYIGKLNELLEVTPYKAESLTGVVISAHKLNEQAVFNNAAQALNHELFWNSISPAGTGAPEGGLAVAIDRDFGGLDALKEEVRQCAVTLLGSGWVWLVSDEGRLRVVTTQNAGTPVIDGLAPLLTLDVWEHAYYLDVRNDRARYVDTFLNELVDWSAASGRFGVSQIAARAASRT